MDAPLTGRIAAGQVASGATPGAPVWVPGVGTAWTIREAGVASVVCDSVPGERRTISGDSPPAGRATVDATPDGRIVYPAADGRLVLVDPRDPAGAVGTVGPGRVPVDGAHLTAEGVRASAPAVSPDGRFLAYVAETQETCAVAVAALGGSAAHVVCSRSDFAFDPSWSPDGALLAWHEWDFPAMPWDDSRIVVYRWPDGPSTVVAGGGSAEVDGVDGMTQSVGQPRFSPDGTRLAYLSDRGGWMNIQVCAPDGSDARPASGESREQAEPTWGPGQRSYAWAPDSTRLGWCSNRDGAGVLVVGSLVMDSPGSGAQPVEIASGWHRGIRWSEEGGLLAVRSAPDESPRVVSYEVPDEVSYGGSSLGTDAATSTTVMVLEASGMVGAVPPPEPVTWDARDVADGETLHGLLWRSEGNSASAPVLVNLHGGPTDQAVADWWPRAAYFLSRGWNILTPNGRGSTGHGRSYTQALEGQWGSVDVADVEAALRAVGSFGWGDPHRIALSGGSAGGFTALLACAAVPDLVRAAVVRYPVTDLEALAAATHRFEARYTDSLVGPLPGAAAVYRERSPMTHARSIAAPLLVLQGADDPAVPRSQTDAFVSAARDAGVDVEYRVYDGEGHGFSDPTTVVDELGRTEAFLARHVLSDPT